MTGEGKSQKLAASTTPPFSTQEPNRYQAVRTITSSDTASSETRITRSRIARDGSMRREEYETSIGDMLVYLEVPAGRFVLRPATGLFVDLNEVSLASPVEPQRQEELDLSADRILNQTVVETRYERLGPETINGRSTTKYRVWPQLDSTATVENGETLIWVDDTLKIPVRWETNAMSGESQTKTVMELSEINLTVDAGVFALPANYRKANSQAFQGLIVGNGHPPNPADGKK